MSIINSDEVVALIKDCVAEHILPRYQALEHDDISTKSGPTDLVTQADIDAEKHYERVLPALLPGSIVMGEEGVSRGEISLDVLKDKSRPVWVVDPVDGTSDFVHGNPGFGTMVALVVDGEVQHGWIYEIIGKQMLVSEKGAGAFHNGERIVMDQTPFSFETMKGHMSLKYFPQVLRSNLEEKNAVFDGVYPICCASEYLNVAMGKTHFSLYSRLKPWDHLPGVLIVREGGGYLRKWDGGEFSVQDEGVGLLVANCEESWRELHEYLIEENWVGS